MTGKDAAIQSFLDAVAAAFGADAFPTDPQQPDAPNVVVLTSARDDRFSISVVALPDRRGRYSVMVELYDPPSPSMVPFEIAEDREVGVDEAIRLLDRYREWRRT